MNNNNTNRLDGVSLSSAEKLITPKFSFYKRPIQNVKPNKVITLYEAYELIKGDNYKRQTTALRAITDKEQARKYKAESFDYVTFSGTFSKRSADALIEHSGLCVLDFDYIYDVAELKRMLLKDHFFDTELLFVSPSGSGLKWIVSIDLKEDKHLNWFLAITNYVKTSYQIEIDTSGKDICRASFLGCDEQVYINPKHLQFYDHA